MSGAGTPTVAEPPALVLDDRDMEPRTPMKRLGSTRKLAAFNNIRVQLVEQTRVLEARAEAAAGVAGELGDYCRRRADLEHEYARALDKLARAAAQRHKDQKHKREQWSLVGGLQCWQAALEQTRALSRDHAALADLYAGPLAARMHRAAEDAARLHRKCRDIVMERQEELAACVAEAGAAGKAHAAAAAEWRAAADKLRLAARQRDKAASADPPRTKKLKAIDKELEKRRARHSEARARALRARADYVLSVEAANAALQRYYLDDIADIMLCMEVGMEAVVGGVSRTAARAETECGAAAGGAAAALLAAADALDALADRQRLVAAHAAAFAPPRPLPYRGPPPQAQDQEMRELVEGACDESDEATEAVVGELRARLHQLEGGARCLRAECRENAKTLDVAEDELIKMMEGAPIDVKALFGRGDAAGPLPLPPADDDAPRRDQEDYYLAKFRSYVSCAGRLARLESKAAAVRTRLLGPSGVPGGPCVPGDGGRLSPPAPARRAALRRGHFAAPLDLTLPTVLTSCVRVIATYGLRHQGIFRVSGSQVEMQALRAAFERGEDPLAAVRDATDINSVCGLLKLYLRELRPPLIPGAVGEALLRAVAPSAGAAPAHQHQPPAHQHQPPAHQHQPPAHQHQPPAHQHQPPAHQHQPPAHQHADEEEVVARLRDALATLPTPNMIVLRYLTAFLAHLTEHSEQNMMDAWNVAICLGPTLLAARGEGGAQVAQQNLVNDVLKRVILRHKDLFPQDVAPHTLYCRNSLAEATEAVEEEEESHSLELEGDGERGAEEPDGPDRDERDDLSLYADDDDEISEDGESGEWREREQPNGHHREESVERQPAAHQVRESSPAASPLPAASTLPHCRRLAETTPDLVLDLPSRAEAATPAESGAEAGAVAEAEPVAETAATDAAGDTADTFAHNRDTLKKRPAHKHSKSEGSTEAPSEPLTPAPEASASGAGSGSPVPARNTARVAAKFADMTLTGGLLKPALAAKPALLRRPTPHPQHARPAAAAPPAPPGE